MTITVADYNKYGCPECGSKSRYEMASGPGGGLLKCASCASGFVVVNDDGDRSPFGFGDPPEFPLAEPHPKRVAAEAPGGSNGSV